MTNGISGRHSSNSNHSNHSQQTDSDNGVPAADSNIQVVAVTDVQIGDRVIWPSQNGYERATVKWSGVLPTENQEDGEMLVGVEFVSILI